MSMAYIERHIYYIKIKRNVYTYFEESKLTLQRNFDFTQFKFQFNFQDSTKDV